MEWSDEGFLLSKNNFDENSTIIEAITLKHGKYSGIVYGGSSRKYKKVFQIGNKIFLNWKSKGENRPGYFTIELIKPISPFFFDDKKKLTTILSASSILKILLPERQLNEKIYYSYENLLTGLNSTNWIKLYILWELSLIRDLGFGDNFPYENSKIKNDNEIKKALNFNRKLLMENFIIPNKLKFPLFRNVLEKYFN
jgi:DNA repair protein RecO (recombination protein O)